MKQTRLLSKTITALFIALIPILTIDFLLAGTYCYSNQANETILGMDIVLLIYLLSGIATLIIVAIPILIGKCDKRTILQIIEVPGK